MNGGNVMIANGNYMQKEIAYCGERELEDMDYLPVRENVSEILLTSSEISSAFVVFPAHIPHNIELPGR